MLEAKHLVYKIKQDFLVNEVSCTVQPGEFVVVMGANGAGKSTLLKMISGAIRPTTGEIIFNRKDIRTYTAAALAKQRAVLSQQYHISFPVTAREVVMMGRYPYFRSTPHRTDEAVVNAVMEQLQLSALAPRAYHTLSGGEAQKIQMCRVLAQVGHTETIEPRMLLLDEPVSHLDIKYQHQLLRAAKALCKEGVGVLSVLHELNLALKYADRVLFMKQGKLVAQINHANDLSTEVLKEVFDVDATIHAIPGTGEHFIVY